MEGRVETPLAVTALRGWCGVALCAALSAGADTDVPFVTTPDNVTLEMLRLAGVGSRDHVIDLGSGDGRIVIVAAQRFGASGLGVEIVPDLVRKSNDNARRAGVAHRVRFVEQDLFATDLSAATVVTLYLLPDVNLQLRPRLLALKPGTRIVSHDWDMGDWKPDRSIRVDAPDKAVGREKSSLLHLWMVPARVDGVWCGGGAALRLEQRFQSFAAELKPAGAPARRFEGRIDGAKLQAPAFALRADGDRLTVADAPVDLAPLGGVAFARASGVACP